MTLEFSLEHFHDFDTMKSGTALVLIVHVLAILDWVNSSTPEEEGFKYNEADGTFEATFDEYRYRQGVKKLKVTMKLREDGQASFAFDPPGPLSERLTFGREIGITLEGDRQLRFPLTGWTVPPNTKTGYFPMGHEPQKYGFKKETSTLYILTYKTSTGDVNTINMKLSMRGEAKFYYSPLREYFPPKIENDEIEIDKEGENIKIPLNGWDPPRVYSKEAIEYPTWPPDIYCDARKYENKGDNVFEKTFTNPERKKETIRIRLRSEEKSEADFNYNSSPYISEKRDGSLELKYYLEGYSSDLREQLPAKYYWARAPPGSFTPPPPPPPTSNRKSWIPSFGRSRVQKG